MSRDFFHDFLKDDGSPITAQISVEGSNSPTTYSPNIGAVGGDAAIYEIVAVWPSTEEYEALIDERGKIMNPTTGWQPRDPLLMTQDERQRLADLDDRIADLDAACALTDAERERMEGWLAEHVPTWDLDDGSDLEF